MDLASENAALRKALAERDAEIASLKAMVERLTALVKELEARLNQNSSNSSKPPSNDSSAERRKRQEKQRKKKSAKKRGARFGHVGRCRELLPASQVDEVFHAYPRECENCWKSLPKTPDANPIRTQVTELPPIKPHVKEYQRHAVTCGACQYVTRAKDTLVPKRLFGPRLLSLVALFTGVYHLSRRRAQKILYECFEVRMSLGAISQAETVMADALSPAVDLVWENVRAAKVKHTDGTGWYQNHLPVQLWTIATSVATVYKIVLDGSKETLRPLFGKLKGILVSDRAKALTFWTMDKRQVCWSHLLRKFVSFAEKDGVQGRLGRELVCATGILFSYWHDFKDGKLTKAAFLHRMEPLKKQMEHLLSTAVDTGVKEFSGSCKDILFHRQALWTFVDTPSVEPTNNHAEQELRNFVLWRKRCFGSQSERGNRFAENIMTVVHTARKQKLAVWPFLIDSLLANKNGTPPPSLLKVS